MLALYISLTVFILLLLTPIYLEARVSFNLLENSGVVSIYIFKIKLFYYFVKISGNQILLSNEKDTKSKSLDFNSMEVAFYEELMKQIKQKTRLRYLQVYYNIGLSDAFLTSMVCGYINVILLTLFTAIKNSKPTASLGVYDTVSYNKTVVEVAANVSMSLTLFDLAYSFVNSLILSKREYKKSCETREVT